MAAAALIDFVLENETHSFSYFIWQQSEMGIFFGFVGETLKDHIVKKTVFSARGTK
jgi:hypothetical protein